MKKHLVYILIAITAFVSCEAEKNYHLKQLDGYSFRKNYYVSDTITGKALDKFIHRNPVQNYDYKSKKGNFYDQLTKHGIIQNKELMLSKLDSFSNYFDYKISDKTVKLLISFPESFETEGLILSFRDQEEKNIFHTDTVFFSNPTTVTYSTIDLNNDGTDELYMLAENYAINGNNYELSIYELTEK